MSIYFPLQVREVYTPFSSGTSTIPISVLGPQFYLDVHPGALVAAFALIFHAHILVFFTQYRVKDIRMRVFVRLGRLFGRFRLVGHVRIRQGFQARRALRVRRDSQVPQAHRVQRDYRAFQARRVVRVLCPYIRRRRS